MRQVKIKVRASETVQFPGVCVHCAYPATATASIQKRIGRVTRIIDVPVCEACRQELRRQSAAEERWRKLDTPLTAAVGLLALLLIYLLLPSGLVAVVRGAIALAGAGIIAAAIHHWIGHRRDNAARALKKEIRRAAAIVHFSWRATTFQFTNEVFAKRFVDLNQPHLMDL